MSDQLTSVGGRSGDGYVTPPPLDNSAKDPISPSRGGSAFKEVKHSPPREIPSAATTGKFVGDVVAQGKEKTPPRAVKILLGGADGLPIIDYDSRMLGPLPIIIDDDDSMDGLNLKGTSTDDAFSALDAGHSTPGKPPRIGSSQALTTKETTAMPSGRSSIPVETNNSSPVTPVARARSTSELLPEKLRNSLKLSLSPAALRVKEESSISSEPIISLETLKRLGVQLIPREVAVQEPASNKVGAEKTEVKSPEVAKVSAEEIVCNTSKVASADFFQTKGITLTRYIHSGANGSVYNVALNDDAVNEFGGVSEIVYKEENLPRSLIDNEINGYGGAGEVSEKFWRHRDLAPLRINPPIPHLVLSKAIILQVETDDGRMERFYVPAHQVKEFGGLLPETAKVKLVAQFIKKAPGKDLDQLIEKEQISLNLDSPHFSRIAIAIDEFLRAAYKHNLIHRDLKPANIMYDPDSGIVSIIDTGESSRLRRRGKTDEDLDWQRILDGKPHISNPTSSTLKKGSLGYISPGVMRGEQYGSEVDFFSAAMILLGVIDKAESKSFRRELARAGEVACEDPLRDKEPDEYLSAYLKFLGAESKTQRILEAHPNVKNLIDCYFRVSAGGESGQQALDQSEQFINSMRDSLSVGSG